MGVFDSAWSDITKALPEQQAFEQFYTHGRPGSSREFGEPPTFEDIPKISQQRRGTVHPAIIAMLQRAASRESGSSYFPGERLDHNVPRSRHDTSASLLIQDEDAKPSHNILVEPPFNQRSRKNRAGFMLEDAPDRTTLAMNDPDREIRERRQEDAGPTHRDFEFYMPDGGDPRYGWGKYRSIRQKTPDGQDIVTAGSMLSDPSYPEFDYEIDYSDRPTYEEMYGEPPVGRDTRFINTGEPMDMSWRLLKNIMPDPFNMKKPDMQAEIEAMAAELARRGTFTQRVPNYAAPADSPFVRMKRKEIEQRTRDLNEEMDRRAQNKQDRILGNQRFPIPPEGMTDEEYGVIDQPDSDYTKQLQGQAAQDYIKQRFGSE